MQSLLKKTVLVGSALLLPVIVYADSTVQVYPIFSLEHGGQKYAKDITTHIEWTGNPGHHEESQEGVPTYILPGAGEYKVTFFPPPGYSYIASKNCTGTIENNEFVKCVVEYKDGAPVTIVPPVVQSPSSGVTTPAPAALPVPTEQVKLPVYNPIPVGSALDPGTPVRVNPPIEERGPETVSMPVETPATQKVVQKVEKKPVAAAAKPKEVIAHKKVTDTALAAVVAATSTAEQPDKPQTKTPTSAMQKVRNAFKRVLSFLLFGLIKK